MNVMHQGCNSPQRVCASHTVPETAEIVPAIAHIEPETFHMEIVTSLIAPETIHIEVDTAHIDDVTAHTETLRAKIEHMYHAQRLQNHTWRTQHPTHFLCTTSRD